MLPDPSSTSRPPRPNSIEVKRNYPSEEAIYASRNSRNPQDNVYRSVKSHVFFLLLLAVCQMKLMLSTCERVLASIFICSQQLSSVIFASIVCLEFHILKMLSLHGLSPSVAGVRRFLQTCRNFSAASALRRRLPAVSASALHCRFAAAASAAAAAATASSGTISPARSCRSIQSLWPWNDESPQPDVATDHIRKAHAASTSPTRVN